MKKLLLALLVFPVSARPQIAVIAHTANNAGSSAAINTTGADMIAICSHVGQPVRDSAGNIFTPVLTTENGYSGADLTLSLAFSPKTSPTHTFNAGSQPFTVAAFAGVASGPDRTAQSAANTYPKPLTVGPIAPSKADELLLGCYTGNWHGPAGGSPVVTISGWTALDSALVPHAGNGMFDAYEVQGQPSAATAAFTTNATNGHSAMVASFFSVRNPAELVAKSTSPLPEAAVGTPYNYCLPADGGVRPIHAVKISGSLPPGIKFDGATNCFTGTPTASSAAAPLTFQLTDAQSHAATTPPLSLTVADSVLTITTTSCGAATQLKPYSGCTIRVRGGNGTYNYSVSKEGPTYLPEGMILDPSTGRISSSRVNGEGGYSPIVTVNDTGGGAATGTITLLVNGDNSAENVKNLFPADHVVRLRVDSLPVDTNYYARLLSGWDRSPFHAIFGPGSENGGIPINTVGPDQPLVTVNRSTFFYGEIDKTFTSCDAAIEGYWTSTGIPPGVGKGNDNHILTLRTGPHPLIHELYQGYPGFPAQTFGAPGCTEFSSGGRDVYGGAVQWDPQSYVARRDNVSGADAGGLCLTCYLLKYDEVVDGPAGHAIRATWQHTMAGHVFPGTVQAAGVSGPRGGNTSPEGLIDPDKPPTAYSGKTPNPGDTFVPPMGQIFRLKASTPEPPPCSANPITHNIFLTLKQYGEIIADNGINGGLVGTQDARWPAWGVLNACLNSLHGGDLEGVNIKPALVDWPNSYKTRPVSPAQ